MSHWKINKKPGQPIGDILIKYSMKNKFIYFFILLAIFGCSQNERENSSDQLLPAINSDTLPKQSDVDSVKNSLSPGKDTLVFNLKMDTANQHIVVPVRILAGDILYANLASKDNRANIRISQLGFPDSTFDGPFGRNINYKIKDTGEYKIIIGENMMAGDRWDGDFQLKAWVK